MYLKRWNDDLYCVCCSWEEPDDPAVLFGLYSLLFVCFNKHTHTRVQKLLQIVLNSCLGKFSLQISFKFKAPCGRNGLKVCQCWPRAPASPCMPSDPRSPTSVCVVTYSILISSSHVQKHKCLTNWCPKFTGRSINSWGGESKHNLTLVSERSFSCPRRIFLAVSLLDSNRSGGTANWHASCAKQNVSRCATPTPYSVDASKHQFNLDIIFCNALWLCLLFIKLHLLIKFLIIQE